MANSLTQWFEHRTGFSKVKDAMLLEHIPGGARWRYVWGSALAIVFSIQLLTGILLMTAYSPSSTSAWSSVYYIQYQMDFGWLIRGLHHFGSQTMVVLAALHMLQVVIAGAQLPPREINWLLGMLLLGVVLGLSLTGYLLPWDQKGYWATQVATNIAAGTPFIGEWLKKIIIGGPEYGNATLTRFFALHVAILPGLLIVLLIAHIAAFRRHGITAPRDAKGEGWFWPDQAFRDMVVGLIILGVMLFLVLNGHGYNLEGGHGGDNTQAVANGGEEEHQSKDLFEDWAKAGQKGMGANLDAPADPSQPYPARPEWYFLFLFQLLKYFEGDQKIIGTLVIPGAVAVLLFILPLFGVGKLRPLGHILGVVVVVALFVGILTLTCLALADDMPLAIPHALLTRIALILIPAVGAIYLVHLGIVSLLGEGTLKTIVSTTGNVIMVLLAGFVGLLVYYAMDQALPFLPENMQQPITAEIDKIVEKKIEEEEKGTEEKAAQFKEALEKAKTFQNALHHASESAQRAIVLASEGVPVEGPVSLLQRDPKTQFAPTFQKNCAGCHSHAVVTSGKDYEKVKFTAPDLTGFGTQEWIHAFLLDPGSDRFYGRVLVDGKAKFKRMARWVNEKKEEAMAAGKQKELETDFGKIAAWLATHPTKTEFKDDPASSEAFKLFKDKYGCIECHSYSKLNDAGDAPDLTGYGGAPWLRWMIRSPGHPKLFGSKNRMPTFRDQEKLTWNEDKAEYSKFLKTVLEDDKLKIDFANLNEVNRELLIRYFIQDYRVVFGGRPISGVSKKE